MENPPTFVIDADDATFEEVAIRGSVRQPVVVDFWAQWCAPCRTLGPLLESLADEFAGAFLLVKVDTESAPRTAQQFNLRSIPAVLGIRDQEIVAEFVGAQPEAAVREFLAQLIPSPADEQTRVRGTGDDDLPGVEAQVRATPNNLAARLRLGAALAAQVRHEDALSAYLEVVKIDPDFDNEAARRAMLELFEVLGSDHELTRTYRGQLARLLYR
jgi:putative thioredoxin